MKRLFVIFFIFLVSAQAHAVTLCVASSGLPSVLMYPGTVAVASNLNYGDTIPGTQRTFFISGVCAIGKGTPATIQVGSRIVMCTMDGGSTEISNGIYTTGVAGIGMRVRDGAGNPITNATSQACASQISTIGSGGSYNFSGTLELVRTSGAIVPGSTLVKSATEWAFGVYNTNIVLNSDNGNIYSGSSSISLSGSVVFRPLTCTITAPGTVSMRKVGIGSFPSIGDFGGETQFNIGLQCNDNALVGMTMDAAPGYGVLDAMSGVISTSQLNGQARGFGLQILRGDGAVMPFQSRVGMGSVAANATTNYGFFVRYIRVSSPISAGKVSGALVVTMDYQ